MGGHAARHHTRTQVIGVGAGPLRGVARWGTSCCAAPGPCFSAEDAAMSSGDVKPATISLKVRDAVSGLRTGLRRQQSPRSAAPSARVSLCCPARLPCAPSKCRPSTTGIFNDRVVWNPGPSRSPCRMCPTRSASSVRAARLNFLCHGLRWCCRSRSVQASTETVFKVKKDTKFEKIFKAYAGRKGVPQDSLRWVGARSAARRRAAWPLRFDPDAVRLPRCQVRIRRRAAAGAPDARRP